VNCEHASRCFASQALRLVRGLLGVAQALPEGAQLLANLAKGQGRRLGQNLRALRLRELHEARQRLLLLGGGLRGRRLGGGLLGDRLGRLGSGLLGGGFGSHDLPG